MNTNILLPKVITIGFQTRDDTYTGRLGYVTYIDERGKLRKEASWEGWRDKKIEPIKCENIPTEGFVLNKKAGGYSTGWNHRQTYIRVYDPRGFEFEISVANLLYILENTNSQRGKGLEGKFVYGWDGKDLVLLPISAPDYEELKSKSDIVHNKTHITGKALVMGGTYLTKDGLTLVYMGKFDEYGTSWREEKGIRKKGKTFYFYDATSKYTPFVLIRSLGNRIVSALDTNCTSDYNALLEKLEGTASYSPVDDSKDENVLYTLKELENIYKDYRFSYLIVLINGQYTKLKLSQHEEGYYYYEKENPERKDIPCWQLRNIPSHIEVKFKDLTEVKELLKPIYIKKYLKNGRFYKKEGY